MVWNPAAGSAAPSQAGTKQAAPSKQTDPAEVAEAEPLTHSAAALIAGLVGGGMALLATLALIFVVLNRQPPPSQTSASQVEDTIKPAIPEPYREIDLPEETRRRIYDDYRRMARTTVEVPLPLPQGTKVRASLEDTLGKAHDRELLHFAALHDISVDEVQEVIKEGDAKRWDTRPRSHAVRDGKRVYPKEMSEGWKPNPNRK
jgi:hypothetical protein